MAFEISLLFAFAAMLTWGCGDFLIQRTTRKIGDLQSLAWIGIFGTIFILPFIAKDIPLLFLKENAGLVTGLGIITFIAAILNFEALKEGKLSVVDVVLEFELPVTIALSFFFLGETLTTLQAIIILFILCGIILIATQSFGHFKAKIERGVILALIGSIFMGGVNFFTGVASKGISPLMAIWAPGVVFTAITLIAIAQREGFKKFITNAKYHKKLIFGMSIADTMAWVFFSFALFSNEISITTAITESYPAVALILGVWLNKERIMAHQYIGAGIALVCSIILSLTV